MGGGPLDGSAMHDRDGPLSLVYALVVLQTERPFIAATLCVCVCVCVCG